ncbi:hypothetical protein [Marisediminicola sp. LYQ134]|uniref:hypothetical protein n=1 Tax=Marisediminicola sp. LYQ134 TaxID=3391061 RepID=UPI003983195E
MHADWKDHHANEAAKALDHPLVEDVINELAENLGVDPEKGLPAYGMRKVALYAAQVARAQTLGIDPEALRMTPDEANSHMLALAAEATFKGIPTYMLDLRTDGSGS